MTAFSRILIPLDGSEFSERSLDLLRVIQPQEALVTLLQVVPEPDAVGAAEEYLQTVAASRAGDTSIRVSQSKDPAAQILAEIDQGEHDLIVLMTHGRSGPKRWVWGSVTEHVVRHSPVPVLLGNPKREETQESAPRKVLVPLDGSDLANSVLRYVQPLSRSLDAEVVLFSAAWVEPSDSPLAFRRDLDAAATEARGRLAVQAAAMVSEGTKASSWVTPGQPADSILKAAETLEADLIAMTTHGRTGAKRWLLGSVAERVLRASPLPVLLVRVPSP